MIEVYSLLRSVWDEPRPPNPPSLWWRDWALAGVLVPIAVLEGVLRPELPWRVASVIIAVGLVPTLLWRRTRPLLMIVVAFGILTVAQILMGTEPETLTVAYLLILPYSLFRWGSGREVAIGATIIIAKICFSLGFDSFTRLPARTRAPDSSSCS